MKFRWLIVPLLVSLFLCAYWFAGTALERAEPESRVVITDPETDESSMARTPPGKTIPDRMDRVKEGLLSLDDLPEGNLRNELSGMDLDIVARVLERLHVHPRPVQDLRNSIHVSASGALYYTCDIPDTESNHGGSGIGIMDDLAGMIDTRMGESPVDPEQVPMSEFALEVMADGLNVPLVRPPVYHSKPGSGNIIFLDFNGATIKNTAWNNENGVNEYNCGGLYQEPGDERDYFTAGEEGHIRMIHEIVSGYFHAFDVDVTTEEPENFHSRVVHVLITPDTDLNGRTNPSADSAGGLSYVDIFGDPGYANYSPVIVYSESKDYIRIANVVAHEVGHYLGLSHDGDATNEYYPGHRLLSILDEWRTIMGSTSRGTVVQWSKGEYYQANNTEDDRQIIASKLTSRPDPEGNQKADAKPIQLYGTNISEYGSIVDAQDIDWFSVDVASRGKLVLSIIHNYPPLAYMLDADVSLYDQNGVLVAEDGENAVGWGNIEVDNLDPGTYYIKVEPGSMGNPLSPDPIGYTSYGSIGKYLLSGSVADGDPAPPVIFRHPESVSAVCGTTATFKFNLLNYSASTSSLLWEYSSDNGQTWQAVLDSGQYSPYPRIEIPAVTPSMDGMLFRCRIIVDGMDSSITNSASLSVLTIDDPNPITEQPQSAVVTLPETDSAEFSFGLNQGITGYSAKYQWEVQLPGTGEWVVDPTNTPTLFFNAITADMDSRRYRCRAINYSGEYISNEVMLTVRAKPIINVSQLEFNAAPGSHLFLAASILNPHSPGFSAKWQYRLAGEDAWIDVADGSGFSGAGTSQLSISNIGSQFNGSHWRVFSSNDIGITISDEIVLSVIPDAMAAPVMASSSFKHSLIVGSDGSLWGTGSNSYSELGIEPLSKFWNFQKLQDSDVLKADSNAYVSIFLKNDGSVWGMGRSQYPYVLDGRVPTKAEIGFTDVVDCDLNGEQTLFVLADRSLWAIGYLAGTADIATDVPYKIADRVIYCKGSFCLTASGDLIWLGRAEDNPFPESLEGNYRKLEVIGDGIYVIDLNGNLIHLNHWSGQVVIDTDVTNFGYYGSSYLLIYQRSDGSAWGYDYGSQSTSQIDTDVSLLFTTLGTAFYNKSAGSLYAYGDNFNGEMGIGTTPFPDNTVVPVLGGSDSALPEPPKSPGVSRIDGATAIYWGRSLGARSYNIYRGPSGSFYDASLVASNIADTYWMDAPSPAVSQMYWIEAENMVGKSVRVGPVSAPSVEPPSRFFSYNDLSTVNLTWDSAYMADSYSIFKGGTDSFDSAQRVATDLTGHSWQEPYLASTTAYYWIRTRNSAGESPPLGPVVARPIQSPDIHDVQLRNFGELTATWNELPGAHYYQIFAGSNPAGIGPEDLVRAAKTAYFSKSFATYDTLPQFWVRAVYSDGISALEPISYLAGNNSDGIVDYASFVDHHFSLLEQADASISGPEADADHDGRTNFQEFVFYGNPKASDSYNPYLQITDWSLPTVNFVGRFPVRMGAVGTQYNFQYSHDLNTWTSLQGNHTFILWDADTQQNLLYLDYRLEAQDQPFFIRFHARPVDGE